MLFEFTPEDLSAISQITFELTGFGNQGRDTAGTFTFHIPEPETARV